MQTGQNGDEKMQRDITKITETVLRFSTSALPTVKLQ